MFPANMLVSKFAMEMEINQQLICSLSLILTGCIIGLPLLGSPPIEQYVVACVVLFVSTNVAEAVLMALLSRTMPSSLARGTWNSGLLTTLAGLLGRFVGDITSTLCASGQTGMKYFMWRCFLLCTLLGAVCLRGAIFFEEDICAGSSLDEKESDDGSSVGGPSTTDDERDAS